MSNPCDLAFVLHIRGAIEKESDALDRRAYEGFATSRSQGSGHVGWRSPAHGKTHIEVAHDASLISEHETDPVGPSGLPILQSRRLDKTVKSHREEHE
jgi:hypothetical protein